MTIFAPTRDGLRLGLGGAPVGNMYAAIDDAQAQSVLMAAHADGCRTYDTAPHYGNGRSEARFGAFLGGVARDALTLSTKVGRLLTADPTAPRDFGAYVDVMPNRQHFDYSAAGVRRSIEDSLRRLGGSRVDIAFVHDCSVMTHGERAPAVLQEVLAGALPGLAALRRQGVIDRIGVAVSDWRVCMQILEAADLDCLLLAGRYTLLDQSALAELLPLCERRGVRVAIGGPYNSGILATGVRANPSPHFNYEAAGPEWIEKARALEALCERFGVPLRAAALQFPVAHPAIDLVLVGVKTVAHWRDALANARFPIPAAFWDALRAARLVPDAAPTPSVPR